VSFANNAIDKQFSAARRPATNSETAKSIKPIQQQDLYLGLVNIMKSGHYYQVQKSHSLTDTERVTVFRHIVHTYNDTSGPGNKFTELQPKITQL